MVSYDFLSSWMANFGVVPLFLLTAFLFLPCFFNLFSLRILVIFVFDTIFKLLLGETNFTPLPQIYPNFLPSGTRFVKSLLLVLWPFFPFGTAFGALGPTNILLSLGEIKEISLVPSSRFSVGNKDILGVKVQKKRGFLLIKGKRTGYSQLTFWGKNRARKVYHFYVLSKKKQLSILHIAQSLSQFQISHKLAGGFVVVEGVISHFSQLKFLMGLKDQFPKEIKITATLEPSLRNWMIGKVYLWAYRFGPEKVECGELGIQIYCDLEMGASLKNKDLENIKKQFFVSFRKRPPQKKNFLLKIKILMVENQTSKDWDWNLFKSLIPFSQIFSDREIFEAKSYPLRINQENFVFETLASPQIYLTSNRKAQFRFGTEIPYQTRSGPPDRQVLSTQWKFTGLKGNLNLENSGLQYLLHYELGLDRSQAGKSFSGNKEKSSRYITPGKPFLLFKMGMSQKNSNQTGILGAMKIPFLRHLYPFHQGKSFKKILGLGILEEI